MEMSYLSALLQEPVLGRKVQRCVPSLFFFCLFFLLCKVAACCRWMNERCRERNSSHLLLRVAFFVSVFRGKFAKLEYCRCKGGLPSLPHLLPHFPSCLPAAPVYHWLGMWAEPVGGRWRRTRRRQTVAVRGRRRETASASHVLSPLAENRHTHG